MLCATSGELHVPKGICGAVFQEELRFWLIDELLMEPCCWNLYCSRISTRLMLNKVSDTLAKDNEIEQGLLQGMHGFRRARMLIWRVMARPRSSKLALVNSGGVDYQLICCKWAYKRLRN